MATRIGVKSGECVLSNHGRWGPCMLRASGMTFPHNKSCCQPDTMRKKIYRSLQRNKGCLTCPPHTHLHFYIIHHQPKPSQLTPNPPLILILTSAHSTEWVVVCRDRMVETYSPADRRCRNGNMHQSAQYKQVVNQPRAGVTQTQQKRGSRERKQWFCKSICSKTA